MPRRISRLGGTTFLRSFMTNAYSPAIRLRSKETAMFGYHAAVLDDTDPGARQSLGGRVVPDAELEPDRSRPPRQRQDLGGVTLQVLGPAEALDQVDGLREVGQSRHRRRVVEAMTRELRIHGHDPVAASVEVRRNVVGRRGWVVLGAQHRHGPRFAEDRREARIVVDNVSGPVAPGEDHLLTRG